MTFRYLLNLFALFAILVPSSSEGLNSTLFTFTHPCKCKRNEYYDIDSFSCFACDLEGNSQQSVDKFNCECKVNSSIVVHYDSQLQRQICSKPCIKSNDDKCQKLEKNICNIKYVNSTTSIKHIQVKPFSKTPSQTCICSHKYNYPYHNYCIWRELLRGYMKYDAFTQRSLFYSDLKIIVFLCQSLRSKSACNQLANFCIHSFFDTDKNSPCSMFLLTQATDAAIYSNIPEELRDLRPFLFYRRGKDSTLELAKSFSFSSRKTIGSESGQLQLFSTTYLFNGQLERWGQFEPHHVNLCSQYVQDMNSVNFFKQFQVSCELSLESIINIALLFADKQFISVFVNSTKNGITTMQTVPVLIKDAFESNQEFNAGEWQLVKRFQLIGAEKRPKSSKTLPSTLPFEDDYKLRIYKSIRILRAFELRLFFLDENNLLMPLIILNYHHLNISTNTSLKQTYTFDLIVRHESVELFGMLYQICLPVFLLIAFISTLFKTYIFKIRRNLRYCDLTVAWTFLLYTMSYVGNAFLFTIVLDAFYSIFLIYIKPHKVQLIGQYNSNIFQVFIYSTAFFKGFVFIIKCWQLAKADVFFVDWEKPRGSDGSVNMKHNLETSSQCSSIRIFAENNVSAWRGFFIANLWVELCGKQRISNFVQGFCTLSLYWVSSITKNGHFFDSLNIFIELFVCIAMFSIVYIIQCLIKSFLLDKILGNPLEKLVDTCTMANISIFAFRDSSFGFYIHGRSPHGFSDTDISSMIWQLQRESQNMCGKRGLLTDSDFQTYIILPPLYLIEQVRKFLPTKQTFRNASHVHFQKDLVENSEGNFEKNTNTYNRINRFFCAFIDHAIKDLDYIIKEKNIVEEVLGCEVNRFSPEHQGVFYIDKSLTFDSLFLYGNYKSIFMTELALMIALIILTNNVTIPLIATCILNKFFQDLFRYWIRNNIAMKTFVDKRFLM